MGFPDIEPGFWWYALSAPGALSWIFALFILGGLLFTILDRTIRTYFLAGTLVTSYITLGTFTTLGWQYMASALPAAAALSGVFVAQTRPKWLSSTLAVICVATAVIVFSVGTYGVRPWPKSLLTAMGSRMDDPTCKRLKYFTFCPWAPTNEPDRWKTREILENILEDPECSSDQKCSLFIVRDGASLGSARYKYSNAIREALLWEAPADSLNIGHEHAPTWGTPFRLKGLLQSNYILYLDTPTESDPTSYRAASVRFLQSPPPEFEAKHETVWSFEIFEKQFLRLTKRTGPLTAAEAVASLNTLELDSRYLSEKTSLLNSLYIREGRVEEQLELIDSKASPEERAAAIYKIANFAQSKEDPNRSVELYEEVIRIDPAHIPSLSQLAQIHWDQGNTERTLPILEKLVTLSPSIAWPKRRLAKIYQRQGDLGRAEILLRELLSTNADANGVYARIDLARIAISRGDQEAAVNELERAISMYPDAAAPRRSLADLQLRRGNAKAAEELYMGALRIDPSHTFSRVGLAQAYASRGDTKRAAAEFEEATKRAPTNFYPHRNFGSFLMLNGEPDRAKALYRKALELNPDDQPSLKALKELNK